MKLNNLAWKKLLDRSHQVLKADQLPSWISLLKAFSIEAFDTGREACSSVQPLCGNILFISYCQ